MRILYRNPPFPASKARAKSLPKENYEHKTLLLHTTSVAAK